MKYLYSCDSCNQNMYVEKAMSESDRKEACPLCQSELRRKFTSYGIIGAKVESSYYSHALGKVVSGSRQERIEAHARGLEEVGNEDLKKHIKPQETKYPTVDELYKMGAFN